MENQQITVTINGKKVTTSPKTNLVDLVKQLGIEIPHYCYHPSLSVAGNCRMCMVEVEGAPGPVIGCNLPLKDGMVIHTESEKVVDSRKWNLEFLLAQHPLDCPVCDKAGECDLQNYSYKYGKDRTDFQEVKRRPPTTALSDKIVLEMDRCILCTRCIRFLKEVGGKEELYIQQRGNAAQLTTAPGKKIESPYQLNATDICPVGALSPKNFRFAERVWNLETVQSICPLCPRGCSTFVDIKENVVQRVYPRFNAQINSYWMCDAGRDYFTQHHNSKTRIQSATSKGRPLAHDEALKELSGWIEKNKNSVLVLVSNWLCNEDYEILKAWIGQFLPKAVVSGRPFKDEGDHLLIRYDFGPNAVGLRKIFGSSFTEPEKLGDHKGAILSFGLDPKQINAKLSSAPLAYIGSYQEDFCDSAELVLPLLAHGELEGSFTNFQGVVQKFPTFLRAPNEIIGVEEIVEFLSGSSSK